MDKLLQEYLKNTIYIYEYPLRFAGMNIYGRMTIIRLNSGELWVHDPCETSDKLREEIDQLGKVRFIIAPGNFHHLFVSDFQKYYPDAETFLCPGLEKKRPDLAFDWILGNRSDHRWQPEIDQVLIYGTKVMSEVVFNHRESKTLILVDLLENIGEDYPHETNLWLKFWWKVVFHMWDNPKAAPEYQIGWGDKKIVKAGFEKILNWDFERIIIAHGNLIESNAKAVLKKAWKNVLT